jgi:hypothetical protein
MIIDGEKFQPDLFFLDLAWALCPQEAEKNSPDAE